MSGINLIPVNDGNLIKIVEALAEEIWKEHYVPIIGENQVKYMLEKFQSEDAVSLQIKEGVLYYLIRQKETNIGYFSFVLRDTNLFLSKIYIKAEYRGKGCAKKVFQFLENIAMNNKLTEINLTVNKNNLNSIKSYEKSGFVHTEAIIQDIGKGFFMDDYLMKKTINNYNLYKG